MAQEYINVSKWLLQPTKTVTYFPYENEILISKKYKDGSVAGEFKIVDTPYGFQLQAYHDSWKVLKECTDLIDLLGSCSMAGVTMKELAKEIQKLGYERDD